MSPDFSVMRLLCPAPVGVISAVNGESHDNVFRRPLNSTRRCRVSVTEADHRYSARGPMMRFATLTKLSPAAPSRSPAARPEALITRLARIDAIC
jgi:hypothetical protein